MKNKTGVMNHVLKTDDFINPPSPTERVSRQLERGKMTHFRYFPIGSVLDALDL
ncbi:unnamed protein product [Larinioides sclopetarius]|uniref:Uncharacterized protein n=1 Tax=Larinioides sclopetarius TaxID=280406 RepID=A0AAV1ZY89_9ARAC